MKVSCEWCLKFVEGLKECSRCRSRMCKDCAYAVTNFTLKTLEILCPSCKRKELNKNLDL